MKKKDKRIIEVKSIIKEFKENMSDKNKHITNLEGTLGGEAENMPLFDNVRLIHLLMI